jgi:dTDP-4-amino-4,6-dideoxygalactose transaminase
MKIPFHKPIFPKNINSILKDSTNSGWVTTGPKVKLFEEKLSEYLSSKYVIALNSCTAALHLGLAAKGIGQGDKFIAPSYTFVATVEVGEYLGARPVLVDCNYDNFNIDLDKVEQLLAKDKQKKIKAIIPVYFAGKPFDYKRLNSIAKKYNLFVLEDAAHAIETISELKVRNTVALSFYANKNITTGGEGGALATNSSSIAEKVRKLSLHGISKDGWQRFKVGAKWKYDVSELGYKYNMTDIAASFGLNQLENINSWRFRRIQIVNKYNLFLSEIEGVDNPEFVKNENHSWHLYIIKINSEKWKISRDEIINKLNERGIGTSVHYIPVHMHSYYFNKYGYKPSDFPISKKLSESVISLPLYPRMNNGQVEYIASTLLNIWNNNKL